MTNQSDEIRTILEAELEAHEELLELKRRERRELVRGSVESLLETVGEIETVLGAIERLETRRRAACRTLPGRSAEDRAVLTVAESLDRFRGESDGWSEACRERFGRVIREIQRVNRETRYLAKASLDWANENLRVLSGAGPARNTYDLNGVSETVRKDSLLVSRTV